MRKLFFFLLCCTVFADNPYRIHYSFNAGELSELLAVREDLSKYQSGCSVAENVFVLPQGALEKRPGTVYVAESKENTKIRLIPFEYAVDDSYVLEFGNLYVRFYAKGAQVQDGGSAYEITSPYGTDELFDIHYAQSADVLYLTHKNHPVYKLSRLAERNWTLEEMEWTHVPFAPENITQKTMRAVFVPASVAAWKDATAYKKGDMVYIKGNFDSSNNDDGEYLGDDVWYLTCIKDHTSATATNKPVEEDFYDTTTNANPGGGAWAGGDGYHKHDAALAGNGNQYWYPYGYYDSSATTYYLDPFIERGAPVALEVPSNDVFEAGHIGSRFQITYANEAQVINATYTANTITQAFRVEGDWSLTTTGTWTGTLNVQSSPDYGNTWHTLYPLQSTSNKNYTISGSNDKDVFMRLNYAHGSGTNIGVDFRVDNTETGGEVLITSIGDMSATIPDGSSQDSYPDCIAHYKLNDAESAWVDGSALGSYGDIVAHYLLDDSAASSTVLDASGNDYHATLYANTTAVFTSTVADAVNYKVTGSFDLETTTTAHNIEAPSDVITALGAGNRSVVAWIRPESFSDNRIFEFAPAASGYTIYMLGMDGGGSLRLAVNDAWRATFYPAMVVGKWYLVGITYNSTSSESNVYLNGVRIGTYSAVTPTGLATSRLLIGAEWTGAATKGYSFDGNMDNVMIFKDVLTEEEMTELYSAGRVADSTTNDYHASLQSVNAADITDNVDSATHKVDESDNVSFDFESTGTTYNNIVCPDAIIDALGTGSRTISMWIRPESFANYNCIFGFGNLSGNAILAVFLQASGKTQLSVRTSSGLTTTNGTTTLVAGTWYHIVCTYNATTAVTNVYVNGTLDNTQTRTPYQLNNTRMMIGADWLAASTKQYYFDGLIDNVQIFNRVLTPFEIAELISSTIKAYGTVVEPVYDERYADTPDGTTAYTARWAEAAWSPSRGYPKNIAFFEDRLALAGTAYNPDTVWLSATGDYANFGLGADDDEAISFTLASSQVNQIQWMASKKSLLIGTAGGEWSVAGAGDEPITPANIRASMTSTHGSNGIQAAPVSESVLFFQRGGKKMREMAYNWEADSYVAPDMTILNPSVTGGGITAVGYQQSPDSLLWCVRSDGYMPVFSYERKEQITGWTRLITDGAFESVAVINGDTESQVWVSVNRTIDSATKRYIEYFSDRKYNTDSDAYFVDCGVKTSATDATTISGLDHLEGEVVVVLADGVPLSRSAANLTVTSGSITIADEATTYSTVHVGLPYTVQVRTMPLSYVGTGMTIQGRIKRINEVISRHYESGDYYIGRDATTKELVSVTGFDSDFSRTTFPPGFDRPGYCFIYQQSPEPLTLLGLMLEFATY